MVDTPQKIEFDVEADASQVTRASRATADELGKVISQVGLLEAKMRQLFTGDQGLTGMMRQYTQALQTVQTLPAQMNQITRAARMVSTGGPTTALQNATLQGLAATARADPAMQLLAREKQVNQVLEARRQIYQRMRSAMGDNAQPLALAKGYRDALSALGEMPEKSSTEYRRWMDRTRGEMRRFEGEVKETRASNRMMELRADADLENRKFDNQRNFQDRSMRADALLENRRRDQHAKFIADTERRDAEYLNRKIDRDRAAAARNSPEARRERIQTSVNNRREFQNFNGGADNFASRMAFSRDFAAQAALFGSFAFAARGVVELQTNMKQLQAISKATDTEMAKLQTTIFSVGQATRFSVNEISQAATVLAQAGYTVQQIDKSLPAIANLATGAGATLEEAVNITTSVLSIYDMSVERTTMITNMLAESLNGSKLSLDQLSLGVQYAGNIAADGGVRFEELTSALGAMANAGIKSGSTLGTGMRALLTELENPSEKFVAFLQTAGLTAADVDVRVTGLSGAMETLAKAGFNSGEALNSFDVRAAAAYSALSRNMGTYNSLLEDLNGTEAATQAAATQMESLSAQATTMANAFIQFSTTAGAPFLAMIQSLMGGIANLLTAMSGVAPVFQIFATIIASLAVVALTRWIMGLAAGMFALTGAASAFNTRAILTALAMGNIQKAAVMSASAVRAFSVALLANPLTAWTLVLTVATTALFGFQAAQAQANQKIEEAKMAASEAAGKVTEYKSRVGELNSFIDMLITRHATLSTRTTEAGAAAERARSIFGEWGVTIDSTGNKVEGLIGKLIAARREMALLALDELNKQERELNTADRALRGQGEGFFDNDERAYKGYQRIFRADMDSDSRGVSQQLAAILTKLVDGQATAADMRQFLALARQNEGKYEGNYRGRTLNSATDTVARALARLDEREANDRQRDTIATERARLTTQTLPNIGTVATAVAGAASFNADEVARLAGIKDPRERNAAMAEFAEARVDQYNQIEETIRIEAFRMLGDPDVNRGFAIEAARRGITTFDVAVEQVMDNTPKARELQANARNPDEAMDPAVLRASSSRLRAEIRTAQQASDTARVRLLTEQKRAIDRRILLLSNPDSDPLMLEAEMGEGDGATAATLENQAETVARRQARQAATSYARSATALQGLIEQAAGNAPLPISTPQGNGFILPVNGARQSSSFGMRVHPITGERKMHNGLDLAAPNGTAVNATGAGEVIGTGSDDANGNWIKIRHANGYESTYAHLENIGVRSGNVDQGQQIGTVGSTGSSTGNHLHFTMRKDGQLVDPTGLMGAGAAQPAVDPQAEVKALLDQWKAAKIEQIRSEARSAGPDGQAELEQRLADFEIEADEYFNTVLNGNLADAKKLIAEAAARSADQYASSSSARLRLSGGDLATSLSDARQRYDEALVAAIDASDQEFRGKGLDPEVAPEAIARRETIIQEYASKSITATLDMMENFFKGEEERLDAQLRTLQRQIDVERSRIAMLSNPTNSRRLGDTSRGLGALAGERLDVREAGLDVTRARGAFQNADAYEAMLRQQRSETDDPAQQTILDNQIAEASVATGEMADNLARAQLSLRSLTDMAPGFQSMTEAINGAWEVFLNQSDLMKGFYEQLADGMMNVFQSVQTGMQTLVKDIFTGTKSMKDAFKDFALSVLDSFMDMVSKMLANQMFLWVMESMGLPVPGSSGKGGSTPAAGGGGGWMDVISSLFGGGKKMALGGEITGGVPFRDSVNIQAMPGEVLMRKSAVDMVGRDTLLGMNARGNSRLSNMPSMGQAMPQREPDKVNVYVVSPNYRPPPGKREIVAMVGEDIMTDGTIKKLIQQVQMGGG